MGTVLHTLRNMVTAGSDDDKQEILERLDLMQELAESKLRNAAQEILNGERGDQQIHTGTVVERQDRVGVQLKNSSEIGDKVSDIIKPFFSSDILGGVTSLLDTAAGIVLGNTAAGKAEEHKHFLIWENDAVIVVDVYMYSYTFKTKEAVDDTESVIAGLLMKRVVPFDSKDLNPAVLMWAIEKSFNEMGMGPKEKMRALDEIKSKYKQITGLDLTS